MIEMAASLWGLCFCFWCCKTVPLFWWSPCLCHFFFYDVSKLTVCLFYEVFVFFFCLFLFLLCLKTDRLPFWWSLCSWSGFHGGKHQLLSPCGFSPGIFIFFERRFGFFFIFLKVQIYGLIFIFFWEKIWFFIFLEAQT